MFRFTMALLITAALLVCPLRCQLHANTFASDDAAVTVESGCGCCHSPSERAPDWQSEQCPDGERCPEGDCDCSGCICQGAVVELHDSLDALHPILLALSSGVAVPSDSTVSLVERRGLDRQMPHAGRFLNGRAARLAQHSLLI